MPLNEWKVKGSATTNLAEVLNQPGRSAKDEELAPDFLNVCDDSGLTVNQLDEVCRVDGRDKRVKAESHCAQIKSSRESNTGDSVQSGQDPGELRAVERVSHK